MSMGWSLWIRWTYAMKEWRTQLLCCAEVLWHARPACSEAVWGGWPGLGRWLAGMVAVVVGVAGGCSDGVRRPVGDTFFIHSTLELK